MNKNKEEKINDVNESWEINNKLGWNNIDK